MLWLILKRFSKKKKLYLHSDFFRPKNSFHLIWTQRKTKFRFHLKNCCISKNLLIKNIFCWNSICHSIKELYLFFIFFHFLQPELADLTSYFSRSYFIAFSFKFIFSRHRFLLFCCLLYSELKPFIEEKFSFEAGIDFPHSLGTV